MATVPKVSHDVSTPEGAIAGDAIQGKWYEHMQGKSAADRYKYLTASGWTQLGKEKIKELDANGQETGKEFVRVSWEAPKEYGEKRPFNQTRALLYEIWLDLERNGYIHRGGGDVAYHGTDTAISQVTA